MVWGAAPLACAAGIFCPREEVFLQRDFVWASGTASSGGEAGEDGILNSCKLQCLKSCLRHASGFFVSKSWCFVRGAGTCIQECFHWLLSPPLLSQSVSGWIEAQDLSELSLLSLIIQQVPKCLVCVSVWSASLTALPVISVTGLNSHQACALPLVTNAQCIFLIDCCSLLTQARKESEERTWWEGDFSLDLVEDTWGLKAFNCSVAVEALRAVGRIFNKEKNLRLNPSGCPGKAANTGVSAGSDPAALS